MAKFSIAIGMLLILVGLVAYAGIDKNFLAPSAGAEASAVSEAGDPAARKTSLTAMIPAFVGFPILILGTLGLQPSWRKHTMHGVAVLALLGTLGGLGRAGSKLGGLFQATDYVTIRPVVFSLVMGLLCLILLVGCIRSFMAARRQRLANGG